jgi:hypothetical protein
MDPIAIKAPTAGVRRDLDPEDISDSEMAAAENVFYRDGNFAVRPGFTTFANDINQRPTAYIQYLFNDGTVKIVQGTTVGWRVLAGSTWTDISGTALTGSATDQQVFRTFSKAAATYLLGTNGADSPKQWNGVAATYSAMGGSPPRARAMCVVFDRIVLGNLLSGGTISPLAIDVSANKDFDAGWGTELVALLADTEGHIIAMQEMGTLQAAILKSDAVLNLIAQAGTTPFRIQWVKAGISGPASHNLSWKMPDGSCGWVGKDGLVSLYDGASVHEAPYRIQKQIVSTANLEGFGRGWSAFDSDRRELWIVYPLIGSNEPNGGVMVNMTTMQVYPFRFSTLVPTAGAKLKSTSGLTIGDLSSSIGSFSLTIGELGSASSVRRFVLGESGGQSFEDSGLTDNGSAIPFYWESAVRGQMERFTSVQRIRHRFTPTDAAQTVSLQLGKRNQSGSVTYGAAKTINLFSNGPKATGHRTSAEYFSLRFSGSASQAIEYSGSALYGRKRGKR